MTGCWHGCYNGGWQGDIVAGAFSHPAKISRNLVRKIYEHAFAEGWVKAGDIVVDPFGGIAGTGLDAGLRGVQWIGCELEPRFSELGNDNINLWQSRFSSLPAWRTPLLMRGDSRKLSEHVAKACLVVSSPPYAGNEKSDYLLSEDGKTRRRDVKRGFKQGHGCFRGSETYGQTDGQLGAMKEGAPPALIVSSPPYAEISTGAGGLNTKPPKHEGQQGGRTATTASQDTDQRYGASEGQMARMVVGSPPFSQPGAQPVGGCPSTPVRSKRRDLGLEKNAGDEYGATPGQLQQETGETFWQAAAEIAEQCRIVLQPGGHAIWVTKDFVRNKVRVPFGCQWQALCEAHGFKLVCRHQAMLVAHHGEQDDIFGDTKMLKTERKSFFRRLAEKKGSPEINWEDVICMEKA